jgi:hypothetical protein
MRPAADVTTFSAMFTEMAYQWSHTRRRRRLEIDPIPLDAAADSDADTTYQDEASVRAAMEAALERRHLQRTRSMRRNGRRT